MLSPHEPNFRRNIPQPESKTGSNVSAIFHVSLLIKPPWGRCKKEFRMQKLIVFWMGLMLGPMAALHAAPIKVPQAKVFTTHKDVYNSGSGEHVLMILHLPKESGTAFVEIYNRTKEEISLFQFTLTALGHEGELDFDDLPAGWSAVKEVRLSSLRELTIRKPKAFNANADEITPRLVIHHITAFGKNPKIGKRQI
jgi:hypothetical protein